jgi:hypothetical protein
MKTISTVACTIILAGCAAGHKSARPDPALLASIPAELRMMGAESTWVAKGVGYELVTRSKLEVVPLMSQLDDQSRFFEKMFVAPPGKIIAAVRRVGPPGTPPEASAPVPFDQGPVVELTVVRTAPVDPQKAKVETPAERAERFEAKGPTDRVVKAWLAARASTLTGKPATPAAASATADDPRVPAWAEDALPNLAVETGREDTITARLAMQIDSLYPIHSFLTMPRPGAVIAGRGGRGDGAATAGRGSGGSTGGGGGMGGGGMGGGGMGGGGMGGGRRGGGGGSSMGRGGSRGGGSGGGGTDGGRGNLPFAGPQLFAAQALVFARYLTVREGPAFVGTLIDAQMSGKSINAVFDAAQMVPSNIERLDIEFHRWLIDRAAHGR